MLANAGVGLVVLLNQWDDIDEQQRAHTEDSVADRLAFVSWAPVLRMAAKTGSRLHRLPAAIRAVLENRRQRSPLDHPIGQENFDSRFARLVVRLHAMYENTARGLVWRNP